MKKSKLFILFLFPLTALANDTSHLRPDPTEGLPKAGEGIKIMPLSQMSLPESMKKQVQIRMHQQKTKGYFETDSSYPKHLLKLGRGEIKVDDTDVRPHDTNLKKHLSQIQLIFSFHGIPLIESKDVIGFAAMGKWQDGWTGVVEIFNYKDVGTCSFGLNNMSLDGGPSAHIMEEAIRYDVNQKHTTISVEGSQKSGFLYRIIWSDKTNDYTLECANEVFDASIVKHSIKLAQDIDRSLNQN